MTRKKQPGEPTVLIEGRPAVPTGGATDDASENIASGEPTVLVGGRPIAVVKTPSDLAAPTVLADNRPVKRD